MKSQVAAILFLISTFGCGDSDTPSSGEPAVAVISEAPAVRPDVGRDIQAIKNARAVQSAFSAIQVLEPETRRDHIAITEMPAPPFLEHRRAALFAGMLREAGADSVWTDPEGNVLALKRGVGSDRRKVALAAHLDTVFPEGTDVTVRVRGDTLFAPGIGDDSRGLVEALTVLRAIHLAGLVLRDDLLVIGTVGEEGLGDLRGVKYLFSENGPGIDAWIAIDGGRMGNIVYRGLGSHRYRVTFTGPGGHSWGAFGLVNPHHALGDAIRRFVEYADEYTKTGPKTSYNVGVIQGGTSVNSIPSESWMEIDMRSEDPERLMVIDSLLQMSVREALAAQNALRRNGPPLQLDVDMIGQRPSGALEPESDIVQHAIAATHAMGGAASFSISSTDSNIPISLGLPAITIGRGGRGGNAHSLDEWWVDEAAYRSIQWALLIVLAEARWVGA